MTPQEPVASLVQALVSGAVEIVDLTQPLDERTPVIQLPAQFAQTPGVKRHEISHYDERGPAWAWYWLEIGEHTGTHFDAPIHWISGRDGIDVSQVPPLHLIAPAVVIDRSAESAENPDYLLTVDDVRAFEADHGPLPEGGWLLLHTGWDVRAQDTEAFLNARDGNPHSPGPDVECALDRRGEPPRRRRCRDRRHRRRRRGRVRPAFPGPLLSHGRGKVRRYAACEPGLSAADRHAPLRGASEADRRYR